MTSIPKSENKGISVILSMACTHAQNILMVVSARKYENYREFQATAVEKIYHV
jgi:hypothetical protein